MVISVVTTNLFSSQGYNVKYGGRNQAVLMSACLLESVVFFSLDLRPLPLQKFYINVRSKPGFNLKFYFSLEMLKGDKCRC